MATKKSSSKLKDGAKCKVIAGTHKGKAGTVRDLHVKGLQLEGLAIPEPHATSAYVDISA
jgi:hypothetical protein